MYQSRLREANALDFDDIIMTTVNLLQAFPDVAEHYRRRFRHVLVDEYQDTNHAQYALVRELVGTAEHPVDVPPSESTSARRAVRRRRRRPVDLRLPRRDHPQHPPVRGGLPGRDDDPAGAELPLHADDPDRRQRRHRAQRDPPPQEPVDRTRAPAPRITGYVADTEHDEAQFVADEIDRLTDAGDAKAGDVAVFYRTNAQSRVFEEIFIRVGLPYKVVGGVRFYERKEVRDVLAYLRVLANPEDTVPLRRILNVPKRGIGDRAEAMIDALSLREKITFAAGAAPGRRGVRHGRPLGERRQALQHADGGAAHHRRVRRRPGHRPGGGARTHRLPRRVAGVHRPAGRDPDREPPGTRRRGPGVRAGDRRGRAPARSPTSWSRSPWSPTPTRSPTRTRTAAASSP